MASSPTKYASTIAELKALSGIIQASLHTIETVLQDQKIDFPSPHTPFTLESEAARMIPQVAIAFSSIVSASMQLVYSVQSPMTTMLSVPFQYVMSACLGLAALSNASEACREAGAQGAHIDDIAHSSGTDPSKLARALRVLATNHIFVEVSPDVFANNRLSSCLDTGKSISEIMSNPQHKHVGTFGVAAGVGHCADEGMKAMAYLQDALLDPMLGFSEEPNGTAFNMAFNTKLPMFEWFEQKGNEGRLLRFAITMEAAKRTRKYQAILEGFDWEGLPMNSIVVDVGGGIGSESLTLAKHHPHLQFVVQDREQVVNQAKSYWSEAFPDALASGRITLEAHDFFAQQPAREVGVFILRNILHDWSDKYCLNILKNLRSIATPHTRLIIIDSLMNYACIDPKLVSIPGAQRNTPPEPLLPNGGCASALKYFVDIQMLSLFNGKERTTRQFQELMRAAGWRLSEIHETGIGSASTQKAIGVPM
ncbi:hypothetical protein PHLGIDRAFT_266603 [Phlebiopsis gigantea 11061_1 CR5-6]|uniref:O-methyltransferase C-terminal domain-containing protein n=1 Tax=Phlebiopsis gigantea (strain 11061_1 CR5-6) TaxID=745531 RepID=A0A0C3S3S1_PHLG1|nr:hypothetical protein PHLGIDRAFT_266603 [Phlebiopsis gigantea 11061_1 CR5-6]